MRVTWVTVTHAWVSVIDSGDFPGTASQVQALVCALISMTPRSDGSKPYLSMMGSPNDAHQLVEGHRSKMFQPAHEFGDQEFIPTEVQRCAQSHLSSAAWHRYCITMPLQGTSPRLLPAFGG